MLLGRGDSGNTKNNPSKDIHSSKDSVKHKLTLSIRPVRLKRSIYFRVPNDIVDLISLEDNAQVTLTLEERNDRHLLVYSVLKNALPVDGSDAEIYHVAVQQSAPRIQSPGKS